MCRCTGERLLPVGGHDWRAGRAAHGGIADALLVLGHQPRAPFGIATWCGGRRLDQHLDVAAGGDAEHAKSEPSTEIAIARIALAALAVYRHFRRKPDLVRSARAVDRCTVVPIDERYVNHWNHDPWRLDQAGDGRTLGDGAAYLLPYYLGLWKGYVKE